MGGVTMPVIWVIVFVVLMIFELISMGLTTIWFAGGAVVALILSAFDVPIAVQVIVFLAVSTLLLYFTRPIAQKYFNRHRTNTNVESVPGQIGIVTVDIDNIAATGTVALNGMEWTARSSETEGKIAKGTKVRVLEVQGVKLIVEPE